ncbi:hypothetical protein QQ008_08775 [Fulvivirgaceae bacterium BMA10]|uniref:Uncharacterized protein n=1 Tax=Splendidivirga corallicola TaxID=3051826 RepID=A0ABT8KP17_9BACT|nr:hypothetical protein [Fulvivirgaceae bacterium BMA10]
MKLRYIIGCLLILFASCESDKNETPPGQDNLITYLRSTTFILQEDSLIACAMGGQEGILENSQFPVSVIFYPTFGATNFKYFESEGELSNSKDYSKYTERKLSTDPLFNGYLFRFLRPESTENNWGIVTFERNGKLHISNPIHLKDTHLPTEYGPDLLNLNQDQMLSPLFSWEDGKSDDNAIYFQVIADADGNLLSGTYTYDKHFRFYDLTNVVLNIRDVNPHPTLQAGHTYSFTLMAVSEDNWVNLVADVEFTAN